MNYCALIGDIVDSRQIEDRENLKVELKEVIAKINNRYENQLAADFMIYAGDEIQGLLSEPSLSYEIIKEIRDLISPIEIVFGVGIGELSTDLPSQPITWELDGECYHRARNILKEAKNKQPGICYSFGYSDDSKDKMESETVLAPASKLINSLIQFIESNLEHRTKRQKQMVKLYEKYRAQKKVAESLDVTQGAVSKVLNKALYYEIKEAERNIVDYLESID